MPPRRKIAPSPAKLPPPVLVDDTENESGFTFEEEIEWCIKKLQHSLALKYRDHKDLKAAKPIVIALKTLENRNNPVPKIRKMMRAGCGDYRKEMKEEFEKAKTAFQPPSSTIGQVGSPGREKNINKMRRMNQMPSRFLSAEKRRFKYLEESKKLVVDSEDQISGIKVSTVNPKKSKEDNVIFTFNFPAPDGESTSG